MNYPGFQFSKHFDLFRMRYGHCKFVPLMAQVAKTHTDRVAYYEPAYYEHSFIMYQAECLNKNNPIAFVLNKVRLK